MIATQNSGKQHLENQKLWKSTPKIISEKEKYEIVPKRILEKEFLKNKTPEKRWFKISKTSDRGSRPHLKRKNRKKQGEMTKKKVTRKKLAEMAQKKSRTKSQESGDPENKQIWNP